MINFLRSAPCKTISLLPTIKANCICVTCVKEKLCFQHVKYVCAYHDCATEPHNNWPVLICPWTHPVTSSLDSDFVFMCYRPHPMRNKCAGVWSGSLGCWTQTRFSLIPAPTAVKHLFTLNFLTSVKAEAFQPAIWKWSWSQRPAKQATNKPLF